MSKPSKVILVGPSGVGKTSLVSTLLNQKFESDLVSTVAPAFCSTTIETEPGRSVELQIWDTAGQEQYQAISVMFYREASIALVCYLPNEKDAIEQWIERVKNNVPDCVIILVAMKADLMSQEDRLSFGADQIETTSQFKARANFLTSAKSGEGVRELFREVARIVEQIKLPETPTSVSIANEGRANKSSCC